MSEKITIKSIFRAYDVNFVDDFACALKSEIDSGGFVILDKIIYELYQSKMKDIIPDSRFVVIEANEYNKTIDKCKEIIEILVDNGFRRNQRLIALGGGIIQDITAFTASIIYRGVDWIFFPTTLLAQGDSCIGSKTSINLGNKKNVIGNFYPPVTIYIDTAFIETLTVDDVKSGIGEMLHFYLYSNSPFFEKIINEYTTVLHNRKLLIDYIQESLQIKRSVIEVDEFDRGERNKFNYGHTFGHAIESVTDYKIKHGQAVTVGMDMANYISFKLGIMSEQTFLNLHSLIKINFPVRDWANFDADQYLKMLSKDKKNIGDNIGCILAKEPGQLIKKQIPKDSYLNDLILTYFSEIVNT